MDQIEFQEEMKKEEISDIEVVKLKSAFDRAILFLYKAGLQLINGNTENFIKGVSLVELILKPKLKASYDGTIEAKRKKIEETPTLDDELELALFKYGELNSFLDKQTPLPVAVKLE